MTDKELIDKLAILHNCTDSKGKPNRTAFAELLNIDYNTLSYWYRKNKIPSHKAYSKQYLVTLYELKMAQKELQLYKDIDKAKKALQDFQNDLS